MTAWGRLSICGRFVIGLLVPSPASLCIALAAGLLGAPVYSLETNADSAIVQDFQKRVAAYLQMRKAIESKLPRLKATPFDEKISHHEHELAKAVRDQRKNSRQGDIFTPEISGEIRRLLTIAMQPANGDAKHIGESLRHAEPVQLHLNFNDTYPPDVPLQSTPPTLLENLPKLPPEMEYRIVGRDLILLDAKAGLVVDILTGAFS